jgi:NhaP-type Na+/H+ or K+/H+ antiporter
MTNVAFYHAAVALAAGTAAQVLAARLAVPGILLLLAVGTMLGPDVLGVLEPAALGGARSDLVNLGVTVILFEGGLALDIARLREQQRTLFLLLTLGAAISMVAGTLAAHWFVEISWSVATLYGALMIVTGPTVVTPLLSRLVVQRPLRDLLVSEGVLIDPIGAIVAIVIAEWVVGHHGGLESAWIILVRLGLGAAVGVAGGVGVGLALRRRWIPEDLTNAAVLGMVLLVAALASRLSGEAGLMAAVAQGVTLGNARLRELGRLREFKETLTLVMLSFLFVVLAADLRLGEVQALGWGALGVVGVLIWVARPLAVFAATARSELTRRQRLFVAWICPRGIVAAAAAGLFRLLLDEADVPGGRQLEALVFVTIAATVALQGVTAGTVARLLGVDTPSPQGTIIVGADQLGRLLERLLVGLRRQVAMIDRDPGLCRAARAEKLSVYEGDALSLDTLEEAGARYADTVVALTRNPELNALIIQRVRDNFRVERALALSEDERETKPEASLFPGDFPGVDEVNRLLRLDRLRLVEYEVPPDEAVGRRLADLPYGNGEFTLLLRRGEGIMIATGASLLAAGDRLWCARPPGATSPLAGLLQVVRETQARTPLGEPALDPRRTPDNRRAGG